MSDAPAGPGAIERPALANEPGGYWGSDAVALEFRHAVDCADQHGIPFVWVNDPDELFPYYERR